VQEHVRADVKKKVALQVRHYDFSPVINVLAPINYARVEMDEYVQKEKAVENRVEVQPAEIRDRKQKGKCER
jgi:hypothetical protein